MNLLGLWRGFRAHAYQGAGLDAKEGQMSPWSSALLPPNPSLGRLDPCSPNASLWAQPPPALSTPVSGVIAGSRPQGGLWYGQFSFSAPHTWTAAPVQKHLTHLGLATSGCDAFSRAQGIPTERHKLLVLVSSVCMQWSSSSSSSHQGHRRAGWSPEKAVRMGCSSLCSCSVLGQPASHSEGELLRCGDRKPLPRAFNF